MEQQPVKSVGAEQAQICSSLFCRSSACTVFPSARIKTAFCAEELPFLSCGMKLTTVSHGLVQVISRRATCCYQNTQPEAVGKIGTKQFVST